MNQLTHYFTHLFSAEGFPPRWFCGLWTPFHGWLYILADLGVWSAYFAIPLLLLYFARKRTDLPFSNLFWLFAAFILACGTSHLLDAVIFWWPGYRLLGLVDLFTAIISWVTVIVLIPIVPKALALKSPRELEEIVKARTRELEAAEERYRLVMAGSNDGIWDWDIPKDERYWSDRLYKILGRERGSHPLKANEFYQLIHPEDREQWKDLLQAHLENPAVEYRAEIRIRHADGSYRYCLTRGEAQRDSAGKPIRMAGMVTDITGLKEAEQQLQQAAEHLRQSNRDLSHFASIASHDLQAPLRKISIFHDIIQQEAETKLSPESLDLLKRANKALGGMQGLIADLLAWSKVTNTTPVFQRINLGDVVQQVLHNLEQSIEESGAQLDISPLPEVSGDESQLTQLFQNLIENSIKYQPSGQKPLIQIVSSCFDHQFCQVTVQDNGIGFDPKYIDKIFQPFQRLHGKSSPYEGSGMGLAICQRIVERHGGSIQVESEEGQGSAFKLLLPVVHRHPELVAHLEEPVYH